MKKIVENLESLAHTFLEEKLSNGLSPKSVDSYSISLKKYLRSHDSVTQDDVTKYKIEMQSEGLKLASINHHITHLRAFAYWLMERGEIKSFKINLVRGQQETLKLYSEEELQQLLSYDKSFSFAEHRTFAVIAFALTTGARADTLINLKISDLDLTKKEVTFATLKNKQTATVPLSTALCGILRTYLSTWERETDRDFLFPDKHEQKLTYNALRLSFERYCSKKGVDCQGLHALRHTMARNYIINGGNAFMLQKMLTHSTITMTQHYVHLFSDDLHNGFDDLSALDKIMNKNTGKMHKNTKRG